MTNWLKSRGVPAPDVVDARPDALDRRPRSIELLRLIGRLVPGEHIKSSIFLNFVARPRKALRTMLLGFYRMELLYEVLREFRDGYRGDFSVLEFGTAAGYGFRKILYATRYLKMEWRVTVHGFDTFAGLPASDDRRDAGLLEGYGWAPGSFEASYEELEAYCQARYANFRLHRGPFEQTLTDTFLASLDSRPPILIWVDCDYYSSARTVFDRLLPHIPTGCVVYFDDYDFNFGSRFTGEARLVHELNQGVFGEGIELVADPGLGLGSRRVYRFVRFAPEVSTAERGAGPRPPRLELMLRETNHPEPARHPADDSPFP